MSVIDPTRRRVLITGVGFRTSADRPPESVFKAHGARPNIGAATALAAAGAGYAVVLVARTVAKLEQVRDSIVAAHPETDVLVRPADLLDSAAMAELARSLPDDREIDVVHSAGLSAGNYAVPHDNPYLAIDDTPVELPSHEFDSVVRTLLILVRSFLPRWRTQSQTRLIVVSSMSGIRAVPLGFSHCASKGALHQAVRALTLELNPKGIQISEVLPGIVNTGFYDPPEVEAAVRHMGAQFGYEYQPGRLPQMPPSAVGDAVVLCLKSEGHVLSINLVAPGQFPLQGA